MRARDEKLKLLEAEKRALLDWASCEGLIVPSDYIEQFLRVSDGAEHVVYHNAEKGEAVKTTHANRFGHSPYGEGFPGTPVEYLRRLAWQNLLFGDEIKVVGVVSEEGHIEIVTSQPWLRLHRSRPRPEPDEIDRYFFSMGFVRVPWAADVPLYYSEELGVVALDAHDRNVVRESGGRLMAIDVVVGEPGPVFLRQIETLLKQENHPKS